MSEAEFANNDEDWKSIRRQQASNRSPYSLGAIGLHWLTAILFVTQLGLGWRMGESGGPDRFAVFQLHKSVGISILLLTVARLALRLSTPWPQLAKTLTRAERATARTVHIGFYVLLLGLPLTGWLLVSSSARRIPTYLFGLVPVPNVPGVDAMTPALRNALNGISSASHWVMAYLAFAAVALHVAGALKHHFLDRDDEIARMIPARRPMTGPIAAGLMLAMAFAGGLAATGHFSAVAAALLNHDDQISVPTPPRHSAVAGDPTHIPPMSNARELSPATPEVLQAESPSATEKAEAAGWHVRRSSSTLGFETRWSQGPVSGRFDRWKAQILFAPEALATSHVKVTVDLASVTTNSPDTQEALPGDDWFAASLHPTATFVADRFTHLAGDRYTAHGTLTLRGASHPLSLPFTLRITGQVASMSAAFAIDRTAFGIGQGDWQSTADVPAKVNVTIALIADRNNPHGDPR